jgi:hypothetical protein
MIEQTIPLPQLCEGMARCVREWILPHLSDPMARTQAQILASLLESLPSALGPAAAEAIARNSDSARQTLAKLGENVPPPPASTFRTIDDLMRENNVLKAKLEDIAQTMRERSRGGDEHAKSTLLELQRFFEHSLAEELGIASSEGTDFKSMTEREDVARRDG